MEKPFLFTDLVPPDQFFDHSQLKNELCEGTIPVRTWATGSPFKMLLNKTNSNNNLNNSIKSHKNEISQDGMLNYIYQENAEEDGVEYEQDSSNKLDVNDQYLEEDYNTYEEEKEEDQHDDDDYIPSYSFGQDHDANDIPNNFDDDDAEEEEEVEESNSEDYDDDDYETESSNSSNNENLKEKSTHYKQVSLSQDELEFITSHQDDDNVNDLVNIMNEYNELVNYITSPRKTNKNNDTTNDNNYINEVETKQLSYKKVKQEKKYIKHEYEDESTNRYNNTTTYLTRNDQDFIKLALKEDNDVKLIKKSKKTKLKKNEKKKLFGFAKEQYEQQQIQQKININNHVSSSVVNEKHRLLLSNIVEKRRKEEEDNIKNAELALLKRKKFKEALLKSKNDKDMIDNNDNSTVKNNSNIPILPSIIKKDKKEMNIANSTIAAVNVSRFLTQTTKAYHAQIILSKYQTTTSALKDEELLEQEGKKREHIASIRRKFKEQHKQILISLQMKNKEEERKLEEEQSKEAIRKEKHRLKLMRMLADKQEKDVEALEQQPQRIVLPSIHSNNNTNNSSSSTYNHTNDKRVIASKVLPKSAGGEESFVSDTAVGSALAAIRRRSRSMSASTAPIKQHSSITNMDQQHEKTMMKPIKSIEEEPINNLATEESIDQMKQNRIIATKEQQEKIANYLNTISEQRKKEEIDKKKEEERRKRRAALLSARLLQEAIERKLSIATTTNGIVVDIKQTLEGSITSKFENQLNSIEKPHISNNARKVFVKDNNSTLSKEVNINSYGEENEKKDNYEPSTTTTASAIPKVPRKPKISMEMAEKIANRLHASKFDHQNIDGDKENNALIAINIPIRDFSDWKRKNSVPSEALVFSMTGWYPCVRDALLSRGWYQNHDINSPHANLKWTLRSMDVNQDTLQSWQLSNHFAKNVAITTKAGLIKSLQSLVWLADVDADNIIPRGYDLSNTIEMQAFIDDFRCQRAEGLLKGIYYKLTGLEIPVLLTKHSSTEKAVDISEPPLSNNSEEDNTEDISLASDDSNFPSTPSIQNGVKLENIKLNIAVFEAICNVLEKQIKPYEDCYIDDKEGSTMKVITDLEWEVISNYSIDSPSPALPVTIPEPIDMFLREKENLDTKLNQEQKWAKRRIQKQEQEQREETSSQLNVMRSITLYDLDRIHTILCSLLYHNKCQTGINGKGKKSLNMWIVKPAAKSRGRGISTFMDLSKILKYVDAGTGRFSQWIVQKYIENPLIIAKRKFDLRQWVLVTNWNPLTIYFYDECYARFSVDEYSTEVSDLSNSYIHLVNNSIGKNSEKFNDVIEAENGDKLEGYMWSHQQTGEYIKYKSGKDLMKTKIHPRMKNIAQWSLMCASEMIEHRKNSWELYGFDFMVDDEYNAWLIEINSSPACDYSTTVTERYVQKALVELLSVVLDYKEWENQLNKKTRGDSPNTGGWERIYEGPLLETTVGAFGTDISLKGEGYKLPTRIISQSSTNYSNNSNLIVSNITRTSLNNNNNNSDDDNNNSEIMLKKHQGQSTKQTNHIVRTINKDRSQYVSSNYKLANEDKDSTMVSNLINTNDMKYHTDNNEFDDSDEEKTQKVINNKLISKTNSRKGGSIMKQKVIGVAPVASIPIKVFSVEF